MPKNLYFSKLLDFYGVLLKNRQNEIMDLYYNSDLSLSEIAENLGISKQGVRDIIKRSENSLLDFDTKLKLISNNKKNIDTLNQIISLCKLSRESFSKENINDFKSIILKIEALSKNALKNNF